MWKNFPDFLVIVDVCVCVVFYPVLSTYYLEKQAHKKHQKFIELTLLFSFIFY